MSIGNPRPIEVLLVEDNPGDVELIREGFKSGKITNSLHVVTDGVEALTFLKKEGDYQDAPTPDLVLLDINLPKKNGHEVLKEIRADADLTLLPVVILTTSDREKDIFLSYKERVNAYVTKPVNAAEFIEAVQTIEDFWVTLVRLPAKS